MSNIDRSFQKLLEIGEEYQDLISIALLKEKGLIIQNFSSRLFQKNRENIQNIEIKYDSNCTTSNRLSIELAEKSPTSKVWTPSGIERNSLFYVQGNYHVAYFFSTKNIKRWLQTKKPKIECHHTIKKFYIDFPDCDNLCEFKLNDLNKYNDDLAP